MLGLSYFRMRKCRVNPKRSTGQIKHDKFTSPPKVARLLSHLFAMATDHSPHPYALGQPSTSYMNYMDGVNNRHRLQVNGTPSEPTALVNGTGEYCDPVLGESDSEDPDLPVGVAGGNWGKKAMKGSRWVRRGKAVAWGPSKGEWEVGALLCTPWLLRCLVIPPVDF